METIINEELTCPVCGTHEFIKSFADDGCFVCVNYVGREKEHEHPVACLCKKCNTIYTYDKFGYRAEAFQCKECDKVQWGLTMFERDKRAWLMKDIHIHTK